MKITITESEKLNHVALILNKLSKQTKNRLNLRLHAMHCSMLAF